MDYGAMLGEVGRKSAGEIRNPQLRALHAGVPLAELATKREDALFRPRLLLVATSPAEHGVVAALLEHPQQGVGLQPVPFAPGTGCSTMEPRSMSSCTEPTTRRTLSFWTCWSRYWSTSGKLCPVSTCTTGNGRRGRARLCSQVQEDR